MTPFFSIIIPVYNVAPYLRECLDSVLAQTFTDWEAICIDDGSTDGSGAILDEYAAKDRRFKVIHHPNAGVAASRNKAIDLAQGVYAMFMDSDDYYPGGDVFQKVWSEAAKSNTDIIGGYCNYVTEKGAFVSRAAGDRRGYIPYSDSQQCYGFQCYAFRLKMLVEHEIRFPLLSYYEDPPFLVKALSVAGAYVAIDETVYSYRLVRTVKPINWLLGNGRKLKDKMTGVDLVADLAERYGLSTLYVQNALNLADGGSFYNNESMLLMAGELKGFFTRLRNSRLITPDYGLSVIRRMSRRWISAIFRLPLICRCIGMKNFIWALSGSGKYLLNYSSYEHRMNG